VGKPRRVRVPPWVAGRRVLIDRQISKVTPPRARHPECTHEGSRDPMTSSELEILREYAQDDQTQDDQTSKMDRTYLT